MVAACLVKDPKKRPTAEKLLKHRFFKHARARDYIARTILAGLPPLGDRFRMLKVHVFMSVVFSFRSTCDNLADLYCACFHMPHCPGKRG